MDLNGLIVGVTVGVVSAMVTGFITYFFTSKGIMEKMEEVAVKILKQHELAKHQDSMYTYVERELDKHTRSCGVEVNKALAVMENSLRKMENRQTSMNIKLNIFSRILSEVASKLEIPVGKILDGVEDE